MGGPCNKNGRSKDPKKGSKRDLPQHKTSVKTKDQMGGCGPEGRTTAARNKRMETRSWKQERTEATFEGGQGTEGAVAPYMDGWMDGWIDGGKAWIKLAQDWDKWLSLMNIIRKLQVI